MGQKSMYMYLTYQSLALGLHLHADSLIVVIVRYIDRKSGSAWHSCVQLVSSEYVHVGNDASGNVIDNFYDHMHSNTCT